MPAPPPFTFTRVEADEWRALLVHLVYTCRAHLPEYLLPTHLSAYRLVHAC